MQTVGDVFMSTMYDDETLREALSFKGGKGIEGAERILLRAATAAYLNIGTDAFDYEFGSMSDLQTAVNAAIASGDRGEMLSLATTLDDFNNAVNEDGIHCPLTNSKQLLDD
jgi:hypothetical protein